MGKLSEYISFMQSTNLVVGYPANQEWDGIYDGLKPKLKKMWAMQEASPVALRNRYDKLAKLGAILDDVEAEHGRSSGGGSKGDNAEKIKRLRRKRKRARKQSEDAEKEAGSEKKAKTYIPNEI